ncbi:MAG: DUF1659 domain-containing protein [Oscillospiraceae bacterium]|nr:DUF1659 domain-containing protein [Oscillospiraceae bacterium]
MVKVRMRNSLSMTYKMLNDQGQSISKSLSINNISNDITDDKVFEVALMLRDLMAYANEKIIKKTEDMLLED